jgi:2-haloacid dehalogenase
MLLNGVKALGFDVFGTVVDWRSGIARQVAPFLDRHAANVDPWQFADIWRSLYQPAMEPCRRGERPYVRLDTLHREMLEGALARHSINPAGLDPNELDDLALAWRRLDPWPDAVEGLQRLRRRFLLVPMSNGNIALLLHMARHAGLPWDTILGSEVTRAYKPAPAAYVGTADVLGIKPAELCLVAAHNDDLDAARACGLATAFVARPREHGPSQKIDLIAEKPWDVIAEDMLDLAKQLGC